jgi:uncharacterized protein YqjF (DUF2071 family)
VSGRFPDQPVRTALSVQRWERLTFVHWRYPADVLRPRLPRGLELQTHDGSAWVGLTPFVMAGLRPPVLPAVPGWSTFAETNLRTYVTDGRHDGVWFMRVHCARRLVVAAFRAGLGLPYDYVPGTVGTQRGTTTYIMGRTRVTVDVGDAIEPDSLVDALTGRWSAYTRHLGLLWRVPVEHEPLPVRDARLLALRTDLFERADLPEPVGDPMVHFSPGVHTRVGGPRLARR